MSAPISSAPDRSARSAADLEVVWDLHLYDSVTVSYRGGKGLPLGVSMTLAPDELPAILLRLCLRSK